jgi:hypothetical protein
VGFVDEARGIGHLRICRSQQNGRIVGVRLGQGIQHQQERGRALAHQFHVVLMHEPLGQLGGHGGDHPGGALAHKRAPARQQADRQQCRHPD